MRAPLFFLTVQLKASVIPSNAYDKEIRYTFYDPYTGSSTVSKDGKWTASGRGQIRATAHNGKYYDYRFEVRYKPQITKLSYASSQISLEWTSPGYGGEIQYYEVYRKEGNGSYAKIASPTANSYVDKNVQGGKTYTYKVRAYKYYRYSGDSDRYTPFSAEMFIKAESSVVNLFTDVTADLGNTTYKAILWAYEVELTKGVDATHFGPDQKCTRAQLAVFLHRLNQRYGFMK